MDKYQNGKNSAPYLVCYEIEDNKIVENYADGSHSSYIPNIPHNIDACERKLMGQFQEEKIKQEGRGNLWIARKTVEISMLSVAVVCGVVSHMYPIALLNALLATDFIREAKVKIKKIRRLRLTDYCLTHAMSLKFSENGRDASYGLSENGKKAFKLDRGFKLNHAHLYTNQDLKQLKKVIGK